MMKNLLANKLFVGGVGVVVLLVILLATGILKFKVTRTGGNVEAAAAPTKGQVEQKAELMSKETTFEAAGGKVKMSIRLPLGWAVGSHEQLDFLAGSLLEDELESGRKFRANLNVMVATHPKTVTSFADYEAEFKNSILKRYPGMEEVSSYSTNFDGVDVNVLDVKNTISDGTVVHQIAYLYYLNDKYYAAVWVSSAEETWNKYSPVLNDSVRSLKLVEVIE